MGRIPIHIQGQPADLDRIAENTRSALARGLPTLQAGPVNAARWCIVAGGPSLANELGAIRRERNRRCVIVAVNGTHDYLIERGIIPDVFVMGDARQRNVRFVQRPRAGVRYYICSDCHPDVFDALEGYDVRTWHAMENPHTQAERVRIGGGSTVGLRAINIGHALGYRNFHLFGFDGCVGETHHAYAQPENDGETLRTVYFDDKAYRMTDWMVAQAQDFKEFLSMFGKGFRLTVHSPGVIQHMARIFYHHPSIQPKEAIHAQP